MIEAVRISHFGDPEANELDVIRSKVGKRSKLAGVEGFIHSTGEGMPSTQIRSCELFRGINATVQTIGPVDHVRVWAKKTPDQPLVEAERHADAYIVYGPSSWPWTLLRMKKAAEKASQEGLPPGALEEMGKTWNP